MAFETLFVMPKEDIKQSLNTKFFDASSIPFSRLVAEFAIN